MPRGRRSKSCYARVESSAKDTDVQVDQQQLCNSNGCGGESPGAWQRAAAIRGTLMNTMLFLQPVARVELWKNSVYMAIWWEPQQAPLSIMRPGNMHTTMLRCYSNGGVARFGQHLDAWNVALQASLNALLAPHRHGDGTVHAFLALPPWKNSWTFGVPQHLRSIGEPLARLLEAFIKAIDAQTWFGERVAEHISWL